MRTPVCVFAAVVLATSLCGSQTPRPKRATSPSAKPAPTVSSVPDLIYFNGVIYTGNGFAEDKPETVEAMATGGGKVLAVGTTKEITDFAGPNTHLVNLDSANTSNF